MSKYNVKDSNSLADMEKHLTTNIFLGGVAPNAEDVLAFDSFEGDFPSVEKLPYTFSWYSLIHLYFPHIRETWKVAAASTTGGKPKKGGKPVKEIPKKEEKPADDDDDMFGGDDEELTPEEKEQAAKDAEERKAAVEKKKKDEADSKPKVIAKSIILLDVKVWEIETDLNALAAKCLKIEIDGLVWKTEYKISDVAFGVKKLTVGLVVEDAKVSVDDVIDAITLWEDEVQSVDIMAFNKV